MSKFEFDNEDERLAEQTKEYAYITKEGNTVAQVTTTKMLEC